MENEKKACDARRPPGRVWAMGLLSRLRQPAPAAPAGQWRRGDFLAVPLGPGLVAVQRRGHPIVHLPDFLVTFVQECTKFQPLEKAVAAHAESHGWDSLQVAALHELLPQAAASGLLISTDELSRAARPPAHAEPPPPLALLGISTGGDRLPLLERGVRSFAENLRRHGRSATLLISENSPEPAQTARCQAALRAWRSDYPELAFRFAGPHEKQAFAQRLSKVGACTPEVASFALLDPFHTGFSVGANRNALLLQAAGHMLASLDDDAICRLASPPEGPGPALACFSGTDPYARWLYRDRAETLAGVKWQEVDYLGAHERLLGRSAAEIFRSVSETDWTGTGDELVQRLLGQPAQVLATFAGQLGDPGIPTSAYYLYYDGENRARLARDPARYHPVFASRSVCHLTTGLALGDATACPGVAMALDHRTLLPPFFPVLHAEDYAYGAALWRSCPQALLGHLPLAVYHEPGAGKPILTPAQLRAGPPFVIFEFAHLLRRLLFRPALPSGLATTSLLPLLGRSLRDLDALSPGDFAEFLREQALEMASERVDYLARELSQNDGLPGYWREDVQGLIDHLQSSTTTPHFEIPLDLQTARPPEETHRFMQSLLERYGELLATWPGMVEATRAWPGELMPPL